MTISVIDVAEPPTDIDLSNSSIDSNSPLGAVVGTFSTSDPEDGDSFTYMFVSGVGDDDNDAFTIVGDSLRINSSLDFETQSSYSLRVQTTDSANNALEEVLTINVNSVASSPTDIVLSNSSIDSNSPLGAVVGTFSTTDPDVSDSFTYMLVSGVGDDDNDAFTIVGDSLRINSSLDFETQSSYSLRVQTTDSANNTFSEVLTINVNSVAENSSPTDIVLSSSSIDSNSPLGAVVGTFSTTDPDVSDSFTYMLVSGNNAFTIVGNQLLTNSSLDFETQEIYRIFVQTTDSANNTFSEVLTINVNSVAKNSSLTDIVLSSSSIDSNSPLGAVVGTFSTTDPDDGDSFTYMLVSGNNAFTIVGDSLLTNSSLDFETQSSYSIRVQTTDSANNVFSEVLTINVNDVGESGRGRAGNHSPTLQERNRACDFHRTRLLGSRALSLVGLLGITPVVPHLM